MLTVNKLIPQSRGLAQALVKRAAQLTLDWDTRSKSRFDATDNQGRHLGVFLPRGQVVRGGDMLVVEDGSLVQVQATAQAVMVVRPCAQHGTPLDLLRAAYHLGNRHIALQVQADHLKLEPDHVLADMLRAMHLIVTEENSAFEPEAGAYASGAHAHDGHAQDHAQDSHANHNHGHADQAAPATRAKATIPIAAAPAKPHVHQGVHGPGCGHDHGDSHHHH